MTGDDLDIEMPDLARRLEALPAETVDALPFGVIRLDAAGDVVLYNAQERAQSGFRHEVLGRRFFRDIAPCMDRPEISGRIARAQGAGTLDVQFDHVSDLPGGARDVLLRMRLMSATGGGTWIVMQLED